MNNTSISRGLILEVPYTEKDEAKGLGARWDPEMKKWFVPKGRDTKPFARWIAQEKDVDFGDHAESE